MKQHLKSLLIAVLAFAGFGISYVLGHTSESILAVTPIATPLLNQYAEKELIKQLRHDNTWLSELKSKNNWVGNDVIKIPKRGAAPDVIINNNVYPIAANKREDSHVILSLNKYETENTIVTEDELYALPYEKVSDVQQQHREELEDVTAQHALHAIAPSANSNTTPVIEVSGPVVEGRPTLISKDLVKLKERLDKLNVPKKGRILVLSPEHTSDLLNEDKQFYQQYHSAKSGELAMVYYGFKIYEANYTPGYDDAIEKVGFGAVGATKISSICLHNKWAVKATGTIKRYMRAAEDDPENRENTIGFRLWFVATAIRDEGVGALIG